MYDYFQGTTAVERKEQPLRLLDQIPLDEYHIEGHGPNYSTINHAGRELARINVMPATVGLVNDILYYDRFGNTTAREIMIGVALSHQLITSIRMGRLRSKSS